MQAARMNAETQRYLKDSLHLESVPDAQVKARYDAIVASLGKEEYKPRIITVPDAAMAATVLAERRAANRLTCLRASTASRRRGRPAAKCRG
jgi:hypothetical protein